MKKNTKRTIVRLLKELTPADFFSKSTMQEYWKKCQMSVACSFNCNKIEIQKLLFQRLPNNYEKGTGYFCMEYLDAMKYKLSSTGNGLLYLSTIINISSFLHLIFT